MMYLCTDVTEEIYVHSKECNNDIHCITMTKSGEEPMFYVQCCCNEDWIWKFYMDNVSNYEMVKYVIMDTLLECDDMVKVLDELDAQFEAIFDDIIAWDCECDECCCENCNHRDCLN